MIDQQYPDHSIVLSLFRQKGRRCTYHRDELIVRPDEDIAGVYCIERGFVKAYTISKYGMRNLLLSYKAGEIFPLPWALNGRHFDVFYEAKTDLVLWRMPREDFVALMKRTDIQFGQQVLDQVLDMLQIFSGRIQSLGLRTARERIISRLVFLRTRFGVETNEGILLTMPITHQDIAESTNVTRETVSREMERLIRAGLLAYGSDRRLVIRDLERLMEILD